MKKIHLEGQNAETSKGGDKGVFFPEKFGIPPFTPLKTFKNTLNYPPLTFYSTQNNKLGRHRKNDLCCYLLLVPSYKKKTVADATFNGSIPQNA